MPRERCDLVIVGGGAAALEAAVAARQLEIPNVVMVDKAPDEEFGGNTRFSHTGFRFVHAGAGEIREFVPKVDDATFSRMVIEPYTSDDFMHDLLEMTRGRIDRVLAQTLVEQSNSAVHWALDSGIIWQLDDHVQVEREGRFYFERGLVISPRGGGLDQVMQWRKLATSLGVDMRFDSPVVALYGSERRIEGVRVSGPDGVYDLEAAGVILCAGGYQANAEMRARYLGQNSDLMKVRGSRHDTGEVLRMALDLGARASGQWSMAHCTPIDSAAADFESGSMSNRYRYPFGISINLAGERFFDEGENQSGYTYARTGWAVLRQNEGLAFQIFDQKAKELLEPRYFRERVEADSISALAQKIGVPSASLQRTVDTFNRSIENARPFDATRKDGRRTMGLPVDKTNWAMPLDTPPFSAYPVTGGITFSFGGIEVDTNARVLSTRGRPIRGLYASGDIIGLFFHNYPSMSGQTRNLVFSLLAAQSAVEELKRR